MVIAIWLVIAGTDLGPQGRISSNLFCGAAPPSGAFEERFHYHSEMLFSSSLALNISPLCDERLRFRSAGNRRLRLGNCYSQAA
jgi:hypothetical protein